MTSRTDPADGLPDGTWDLTDLTDLTPEDWDNIARILHRVRQRLAAHTTPDKDTSHAEPELPHR